jgi:hypothetical protein
MVHRVQRDSAFHARRLVAQARGHPGMGALMHTERKDEQDELEDGNNQVGLLQTRSPRAGKLSLAWRVDGKRQALGASCKTPLRLQEASGHDFSRAERAKNPCRALAPAVLFFSNLQFRSG